MFDPELRAAFNEWMRRYIEEPERFEAEFKTVQQFVAEESQGNEPSYGDECVEYLKFLHRELNTAAVEGRRAIPQPYGESPGPVHPTKPVP